jgi:hypothetical protein
MSTNTIVSLDNRTLMEISGKKIELLEEEKYDLTRMYEDSRQIIFRLEQELNDVNDPAKPYLTRLDMQARQASEHVDLTMYESIGIVSIQWTRNKKNMYKPKDN